MESVKIVGWQSLICGKPIVKNAFQTTTAPKNSTVIDNPGVNIHIVTLSTEAQRLWMWVFKRLMFQLGSCDTWNVNFNSVDECNQWYAKNGLILQVNFPFLSLPFNISSSGLRWLSSIHKNDAGSDFSRISMHFFPQNKGYYSDSERPYRDWRKCWVVVGNVHYLVHWAHRYESFLKSNEKGSQVWSGSSSISVSREDAGERRRL